jgi:hypothetical protein
MMKPIHEEDEEEWEAYFFTRKPSSCPGREEDVQTKAGIMLAKSNEIHERRKSLPCISFSW